MTQLKLCVRSVVTFNSWPLCDQACNYYYSNVILMPVKETHKGHVRSWCACVRICVWCVYVCVWTTASGIFSTRTVNVNILGGRATDSSHTHGGEAVIAEHTQTHTLSIERGWKASSSQLREGEESRTGWQTDRQATKDPKVQTSHLHKNLPMGTRLPRNTVYTQNLDLCHPRAILIFVMLNIFRII